jgi:hypothetical protein
MTDKDNAGTLGLERSVWFFLVTVRVTGNARQPFTAGSEATVQAFVPGRKLEDTLVLLDAYLPTQELTRIDTLRAVRYDPEDDDDGLPGEFFRKPLERAAATNECVLGVFFVSSQDM